MADPTKEPKKNPVATPNVNIDWGEDISEPDIDGWHDPEITPVLMGQIQGFKIIETTNGWSDVVIMKTLTDVKVKGNKGDIVDLKAGQSVGVFVRAKLAPILEFVEFKNTLRIEALEKTPIKGGHTMWKFRITPAKNSKRGKPPANSITIRNQNLGAAGNDDTDFP